ncbi:hypothetical protein RDI58_024030 [Solanum bulbocastanum]|uniref:MULE transposase domain-containing protein n=1 Tax=Solanum bulbocastanum TaxID=147425 RepID=A0AAN8Y574_SOLBU
MKLGFKFGLRPLIELDGTFLKGKAKGHVLCIVGQDINNSFYPLAWVVNGEGLTFILDMQKGLLQAVRTILPEAHKRYCARHIEANWCKRWGKGELKKLLQWAAWSSFTEEFEDQLQEIKKVDEDAGQDLIDMYPSKKWCRVYLDTVCKNQIVDNNFIESFNAWILEARYKPIIEILEGIRVKIIERLATKEVVVRKLKDDGFSPKSELLFIEYLKIFKIIR